MLIIEGPDNVGKTTLIRDLINLEPRFRVLRRERFRPERGETIGSSYLQALEPLDGDRAAQAFSVADRLVASECIYGPLFRKSCRLTIAEHWRLELILISYGTVIVHCDIPDDRILSSWHERPQLYDKDPLPIVHAYREKLRDVFPGFPITVYDWTQHVVSAETLVRQHHELWRTSDTIYGLQHFPGLGRSVKPRLVVVLNDWSDLNETFAIAMQALFAIYPDIRHQTYVTIADDIREQTADPLYQADFVITVGPRAQMVTGSQYLTVNRPPLQSLHRQEYAEILLDAVVKQAPWKEDGLIEAVPLYSHNPGDS